MDEPQPEATPEPERAGSVEGPYAALWSELVDQVMDNARWVPVPRRHRFERRRYLGRLLALGSRGVPRFCRRNKRPRP